jgi:predicted sugar kinase
MAVVWKINTLDRDLTQGDNENIITQIHWTASDSDADGNTGSSYGSVGVTLGEGDVIPYADVTEADAIGWAKDALGDEQVTAIEASIASQIDAQANPTTASGVPF